jgi:hypothetical protein
MKAGEPVPAGVVAGRLPQPRLVDLVCSLFKQLDCQVERPGHIVVGDIEAIAVVAAAPADSSLCLM